MFRLSKKNEKYLFFIVLILIFGVTFFPFFLYEVIEYNKVNEKLTSISPLGVDSEGSSYEPKDDFPLLALQPFQTPNIMFIVGDPIYPDSVEDVPFYNYMDSILNYNVTYHADDNSYSYLNYDAIVISQSIIEEGTVSSLYTASIPILTMEAGTFNEFQLGVGNSVASSQTVLNIINNSHYITNGLSLGDIEFYNVTGGVSYLTGYNSNPSNILELAKPNSLNPTKHYRSLVTLDKGKNDWNLTLSPERRAFWGASLGSNLNQEGWNRWNKTLSWILYDDVVGNATIEVNVKDPSNKEVPNARVNLTDSSDSSQTWSQNTTIIGCTTFLDIPYGSYNITVEFESSVNDTLSFLEIVGNRTYYQTGFFNFVVIVNDFVDNNSPDITTIGFINATSTFHANVTDESILTTVNLSLTVRNITEVERDATYIMTTIDGVHYYNDTALDNLPQLSYNVSYNITAIDIAGNIKISNNYRFLLGDIVSPDVYKYNVTDYANGTLLFYANVTDSHSLVEKVTLRINNSFYEMNLNSSGYWIYRTNAYFSLLLNYSIFSANDSGGNEVGSKIGTLSPAFRLITPKDSVAPRMWGLTHTFNSHENGSVIFSIYIEDNNIYQSGVNNSLTKINLFIKKENNIWVNNSFIMNLIGSITFDFSYTFDFNDTVWFNISTADIAGNINQTSLFGNYIIEDNMIPYVMFGAMEFGNGTVEFNSTVMDWPNNETIVYLYYSQDQVTWNKTLMSNVTDILFIERPTVKFDYSRLYVWYYVTANDTVNLFNPTPAEYKRINLTDKVAPVIIVTVTNSTINDGEINVIAHAIDTFGASYNVNNTFYFNISGYVTNGIMDYYGFYQYTTNYSFPYGEKVNMTIKVEDDTGNVGEVNITMIVGDYSAPKIEQWEAIAYQNGTAKIWAEVADGDLGIGLEDDNTSVVIEYVFISYETAIMTWNGSGNFYTYSFYGFDPGNAFTYRIKAVDKNNNTNITDWKPASILDLTPPSYNAFNYYETLVNHSVSELYFWIDVYDNFGNIEGVNISLNYFDGFKWINWTNQMSYNGIFYIYSIELVRNKFFSFKFTIFDEATNINETTVRNCFTHNFYPTTALDYGIEFGTSELNPGEEKFWLLINNTFDDQTPEDYLVKLSVIDETLGTEILYEGVMTFNGTHHVYNLSIPYLHNYSYTMEVIDGGVLEGHYSPNQYSDSGKILDYWKPTIISTGIQQINQTNIIVWANISDWGSGITEVRLNYEFVPLGSNGGIGSQIKIVNMNFNGSLYILELSFSETGTINWFIEAFDGNNSSILLWQEYTFIHQSNQQIFFGLTIFQIFLIILVTTVTLIIILFGFVKVQRKRSIKYQATKEIQRKLEIIPDVYTILISTDAGVPIFSLTNIIYQKDEAVSDALSGLSVGIDTFLQSFRADFMHQVQYQEVESNNEMGTYENIRMSVIAQHDMEVMILASEIYRIFVFLKKKPSKFLKKVFLKITMDIQKSIYIPDMGVVDERKYTSLIETIFSRHFPLALLRPFTINTTQLKIIEEKIRKGTSPVSISQSGINTLKRLVITQMMSKMKVKNSQAEIKLFDESINKGSLTNTRMFLYRDAINIMKNILKSSPEEIYEALWIGTSSDVKIIVPYRE